MSVAGHLLAIAGDDTVTGFEADPLGDAAGGDGGDDAPMGLEISMPKRLLTALIGQPWRSARAPTPAAYQP